MADIITIQNNKLNVPNNPIIPFIEGDGIGPDIWKATKKVIDSAVEKSFSGEKKIEWKKVLAGQEAFNETGNWLPEETLESFKKYLVGIKGPLTTPIGGGFRSLNVALRRTLDLFVCLRPVRYFKGVPSPVKKPEQVNMVIFRENIEDVYSGKELKAKDDNTKKLIDFLKQTYNWEINDDSGIGIKPISEKNSKRLIKAAIEYAIKNKKKSVTLVHKGNIMKYTEGAFKNWGYELAKTDFADITYTWDDVDKLSTEEKNNKILIKDVIADNFLQQILTRPNEFEVIATMNLNGDYISDALAAQVGGIGIAPGANINFNTGIGIFEATHGTAPKYTNMDKVNPGSLILSGCMMLEYLGWDKPKNIIVDALEKTISNKTVTYDFARLMENATEIKCSEFAKKIIENF